MFNFPPRNCLIRKKKNSRFNFPLSIPARKPSAAAVGLQVARFGIHSVARDACLRRRELFRHGQQVCDARRIAAELPELVRHAGQLQ